MKKEQLEFANDNLKELLNNATPFQFSTLNALPVKTTLEDLKRKRDYFIRIFDAEETRRDNEAEEKEKIRQTKVLFASIKRSHITLAVISVILGLLALFVFIPFANPGQLYFYNTTFPLILCVVLSTVMIPVISLTCMCYKPKMVFVTFILHWIFVYTYLLISYYALVHPNHAAWCTLALILVFGIIYLSTYVKLEPENNKKSDADDGMITTFWIGCLILIVNFFFFIGTENMSEYRSAWGFASYCTAGFILVTFTDILCSILMRIKRSPLSWFSALCLSMLTKMVKRTFVFLLPVLSIFGVVQQINLNKEVFSYQFYNGTLAISGCRKTEGIIHIPEKIHGITVTRINFSAFYNKRYSEIHLPATIEYVAAYAFDGWGSGQKVFISMDAPIDNWNEKWESTSKNNPHQSSGNFSIVYY